MLQKCIILTNIIEYLPKFIQKQTNDIASAMRLSHFREQSLENDTQFNELIRDTHAALSVHLIMLNLRGVKWFITVKLITTNSI